MFGRGFGVKVIFYKMVFVVLGFDEKNGVKCISSSFLFMFLLFMSLNGVFFGKSFIIKFLGLDEKDGKKLGFKFIVNSNVLCIGSSFLLMI